MTQYLNQILYPHTKFDSVDSLKLLEPYMYNNIKLEKNTSISQETSQVTSQETSQVTSQVTSQETSPSVNLNIKREPTQVTQTNANIIYPKCTDTLFWCMYIAKYGYAEYLNIGQRYKNKEIEIKQQMIDTIKKTPSILKNGPRKITNVAIQEIMAELMIDKKTTFKTFYAICILNALNIIIVDIKTSTFLSFINDTTTELYIIYRVNDGSFSIDIDCNAIAVTSKYFELDYGDKPIKSIGAYKMNDLEIISQKLGLLLESKKYKKQELYDKIFIHCFSIYNKID